MEEDEMGGALGCIGQKRNTYRVLMKKPERDHLENMRIWEKNIKMHLKETA
jgi:hypothetical protein